MGTPEVSVKYRIGSRARVLSVRSIYKNAMGIPFLQRDVTKTWNLSRKVTSRRATKNTVLLSVRRN